MLERPTATSLIQGEQKRKGNKAMSLFLQWLDVFVLCGVAGFLVLAILCLSIAERANMKGRLPSKSE